MISHLFGLNFFFSIAILFSCCVANCEMLFKKDVELTPTSKIHRFSRVYVLIVWMCLCVQFNQMNKMTFALNVYFLNNKKLQTKPGYGEKKENNNLDRNILEYGEIYHSVAIVWYEWFLFGSVTFFPRYCQKIIRFGILFIISEPASIVLCSVCFVISAYHANEMVWENRFEFFFYINVYIYISISTEELDFLL